MNSELIRKDFPILETKVNGHPVVYFDNGATTQRPLPVMRAVMDYVTRNNGNPHRGAHIFAMSASEAYDTSKTVIKDFIGAKSEKEIIYTASSFPFRNTTRTSSPGSGRQKRQGLFLSICMWIRKQAVFRKKN